MDSRKRKRPLFHTPKFLLFCFSLFTAFTLFYWSAPSFRPAPTVRKLAVFSSFVSSSVIQDLTTHHSKKPLHLLIDSCVVFTDHVLVILSTNGNAPRVRQRIDCVYHNKQVTVSYPILSATEYGDHKWIVRCPPPPVNYSSAVELRGHRDPVSGFEWVTRSESDKIAQLWDTLVYDAVFDGNDTLAVFVKGLHLRSDRESDPNYFTCLFRHGNVSERVRAITAAQEVVRCPVSRSRMMIDEDISVTVVRNRFHQVFPSIARLSKNGIHRNGNVDKGGSYEYELCGCSMVWNQAAFIKEWIGYHAWLGVQRWFVYDNNSDDGLKEVIDELDAKGYNVTRHVWPWVKSQEAGFSHCVLRARDECRWVGFFDVDEFYYLPRPKTRDNTTMVGYPGPGSLRAVVDNVTLTSPSVGEIRTDCYSFGPSGLKNSPEEGVTLGYTCRMRTPERHKSIVRPDAVDDTLLNQVHHFKLKKEFNKTTLLQSTALINHYKYQVWDTFKAKFHRRVSTYVADWQENQNENSRDRAPGLGTEAIEPADWHKRFCEVWDTRLRDFILANLGDPDTGLVTWGSV